MRLHLLVVEPSGGDVDAIAGELRRAGFAPVIARAHDGREAIAAALGDDGATQPDEGEPGDPLPVTLLAVGDEHGGNGADGATTNGQAGVDARAADRLDAAQAALARAEARIELGRATSAAVSALHETDERLRALIDDVPFGVWQTTDDGRSLFVNRAMCALLEVDDPRALDARDARAFIASESQARFASADPSGVEIEILGARGGRRAALCFTAPMASVGGEPARTRTFLEFAALRRGLAQAPRTEKLEAIGRLAGGIAHDFNNLLTVVLTCSSLLQRRIPEEDRARSYLGQIDAAVKRGSALTRQLLAYARHGASEATSIDVNDVVTKTTAMLRHVIREDIELKTSLGRGPLVVQAERGQIEQVLMNLALNARDAMPDGGKLLVSTAQVDLSAAEAAELGVGAGRYVLLTVTDNGHGMDEETRARIFEPFFTTKAGRGTGLGLATVHAIARQRSGAVAVESAPNQGATFRLYLPVARDEAHDTSSSHPRVVRRGASQTVLLVDDEETIRGSLAEFLRLHGFTVLEASRARDALEMAEKHDGRIDVLVTDVVMPRMGGKSLAEAIHAQRPETKVLFLSGYSESTILRRGQIESGVALLQKPFAPEALVSRILDLLGT